MTEPSPHHSASDYFQEPQPQRNYESYASYGGDLMLSEDLLSSISPNFDSQAFFDDFIFTGKQLSGRRTMQTGHAICS